jgi:hypothetical protein
VALPPPYPCSRYRKAVFQIRTPFANNLHNGITAGLPGSLERFTASPKSLKFSFQSFSTKSGQLVGLVTRRSTVVLPANIRQKRKKGARLITGTRLKIGSLPADGTVGGRRSGARRSCACIFAPPRIAPEFRSNSDGHTFRHMYSTLLRSVGTEFKVVLELVRHSTLRSTLDVYTQAITPAKHAAQAPCCHWFFQRELMEPRSGSAS